MLRIGFITCVQLGLSCMEAIYDVGGNLDFAMTLHDEQSKNKSGRVYIDSFCKKHGVKLYKSSHVNNSDVVKAIKSHEIDWLFIIGWSQIASKELLEAPKKGVLGMHPTLLPEGRGRAAIPWAIIKGLDRTGVTLFKLDEGVDTDLAAALSDLGFSLPIPMSALYKSMALAAERASLSLSYSASCTHLGCSSAQS